MPERFKYSHLFRGNPFRGETPTTAFSLLHWGNQHERVTEIDAPEPLVMLGMMVHCILDTGLKIAFNKGQAFLAVGHVTNYLYVVPLIRNQPIALVPTFSAARMKRVGKVARTDYLASKGEKRTSYYYHDHEPPYPSLWVDETSGCGYIRPANHNGKPSYAVGKEGIVG